VLQNIMPLGINTKNSARITRKADALNNGRLEFSQNLINVLM